MFKQTEKLVSKQQYGGYRANIVTYTLAFLSFKTAQRIDLDKIWKDQGLSPVIENEIVEISKFIQRKIANPPGGANIGEWRKKEKCWKDIKEYPYKISEKLEPCPAHHAETPEAHPASPSQGRGIIKKYSSPRGDGLISINLFLETFKHY